MSRSQSMRVAYFFARARRGLRVARMHTGETREAILRVAMNWRNLAKDTRARWSKRSEA